MTILNLLLVLLSVALTIQSGYSAALMLYAWQDESKQRANRVPEQFLPPALSFTVLLPARHEEAVIKDTIQRVVDLNYPRHLVQVLVVIESGDIGTIGKVHEKLGELARQGIFNVRLITFSDRPINKPHGLNIGLYNATGDIVTIFDAEDEPHPDILQVVNTISLRERVPVIQCGVQLMNYADRWFSALNVLEYFFWFRSRLHYHASTGMVPLGGNTVFMQRRLLLEAGGWDQHCLTEDAEIGIRLSIRGVPIRVVYDDEYVTREETPPSASQFIKQRTRWNQGFLQVLQRGLWRKLPRFSQRALAFYTLAFPLLQAVMMLYVPVSIWMMLYVKMPVLVALISSLPLYMLVVQFIISLIGLFEFTSVHRLKASPLMAIKLLIVFLPYQILLSIGAIRAVWRHLRGINNWEKTAHVGAHRTPQATPFPATANQANRYGENYNREVLN